MQRIVGIILAIPVLLLLVPWLASLAYGESDGGTEQPVITVEAADSFRAPRLKLYGKAIGSITPGDLFDIDATNSPRDLAAGLYITNADKLIPHLRYLILEVSIYIEEEDGRWLKTPIADGGGAARDTFITLRNSPVNFTLPGNARYRITIDSGSFYCLTASGPGDNLSLGFHLEVNPM